MALCNESHMPIACPSTGTSYVERSRHAPGKRHRNGATMTKVCRVIPDLFQYVRNDQHVVLQPGYYLHRCLHRRRRRLMYYLGGVSPCLTPKQPYAKSAIKPSNRNAISLPTSSLHPVLFLCTHPRHTPPPPVSTYVRGAANM